MTTTALVLHDLPNKQKRILCDCGRPACYQLPIRIRISGSRGPNKNLMLRLCGKCLADELKLRRESPI